MPGLINFFRSIFPQKAGKAIQSVASEVMESVEKKVVQEVKYLKPEETAAFSGRGLAKDTFQKIQSKIDKTFSDLSLLRKEGANSALIEHTKKTYPIKYDYNRGKLDQYSETIQSRITNKRNNKQIEKILKEKEISEARIKKERDLNFYNQGYRTLDEIGINNPDELLDLINSGKYKSGQMIDKLAEVGQPKHVEQFFKEIDDLFTKIPKTTSDGSEKMYKMFDLSKRIRVVGLAGDEAQQARLLEKVNQELSINNDRYVVEGIFRGISQIGEKFSNNTKFAEVLQDQVFSKNSKLAYQYLSSFDGQFPLVLKGLIENPKNDKIMESAYASVRTSQQKKILVDQILNNQELMETAVRTTPMYISVNKAFKSDVLSEIYAKKFDSLSHHDQWLLKDKMKGL